MNRKIFLCAAFFFALSSTVFAVDGAEVGIHVERGYASLKENEPESAIGAFNQALRLDPNNAKAYNGRGLAYQKLKAYDQALRDFSAAVKVNPLYSEAMHNRDVLIDLREKKGNAVDDYNSYLNYYPDYGATQRTDAFMSFPNAGTGGVGNRVIPSAEVNSANVPYYGANGTIYTAPPPQQVVTQVLTPNGLPAGAPAGAVVAGGYTVPFYNSSQTVDEPQIFLEMKDRGEPIDPNADTARNFRTGNVITHRPYVVIPQSEPFYNNSSTTDEFAYQQMKLNNVNTVTPQRQPPAAFTGAVPPAFVAGFVQTELAPAGITFDLNMSAIRYNQVRQFDLAIRELTQAIKMDPVDAVAYNNRGYAYALGGNYSEALKDFNTAIRLNPYYGDARSNRSLILGYTNR